MIDLADATLEQYDTVLDHLRSSGHYHELEGTILTVQARHVDEVRALLRDSALPISAYRLAGALAPPSRRRRPEGFYDRRVTSDAGEELMLATMPRRAIGGVLDGVVASIASGLIARVLPLSPDVTGYVTMLVLFNVALILMIGLAGVTPAKVVLGTRVVSLASGRPPGLARAALRVGAMQIPTALAVALNPVLPVLAANVAIFGTLAVYGAILFDSMQQGLHDRAAGTVVIRTGGARAGG